MDSADSGFVRLNSDDDFVGSCRSAVKLQGFVEDGDALAGGLSHYKYAQQN